MTPQPLPTTTPPSTGSGTETPLTDAWAVMPTDAAWEMSRSKTEWMEVVPASFARDLERQLADAKAAKEEFQSRLIAYLDSPEGQNFVAAQQRDTANRVCAEQEKELAALQQQLSAVKEERDEAERKLADQEPTYCRVRCEKHFAAKEDESNCEICLQEEAESLRSSLATVTKERDEARAERDELGSVISIRCINTKIP